MEQPQAREYVLGHEEQELRRLALHAEFYRPMTETLLLQAGIGPGMRVLDVGCGAGDVALLAAQRVGPTGAVVGIDRAPEAIARARQRAAAAKLDNVSFVESSLETYASQAPFDLAVGRLVLTHAPDMVASVKHVATHVRPGGTVAFQEIELAARGMTWPQSPLFHRVWDWFLRASEAARLNLNVGLRLPGALLEAGLQDPDGFVGGRLGIGPGSPTCELLAESIRTGLPLIERCKIATREEVDIDTLAQRLSAEMPPGGAMLPWNLVAAWARKPG